MCRCSRCATGFIEEECVDQPSFFLHSGQLDLWDQHCSCLQLMLADRQSHALLHHAYWRMGDTDPLSLLISRGAVTPSPLLHLPFSNHSGLCPQPPSYLTVFLSCFAVCPSFGITTTCAEHRAFHQVYGDFNWRQLVNRGVCVTSVPSVDTAVVSVCEAWFHHKNAVVLKVQGPVCLHVLWLCVQFNSYGCVQTVLVPCSAGVLVFDEVLVYLMLRLISTFCLSFNAENV